MSAEILGRGAKGGGGWGAASHKSSGSQAFPVNIDLFGREDRDFIVDFRNATGDAKGVCLSSSKQPCLPGTAPALSFRRLAFL